MDKMREIRSSIFYLNNLNTDQHPLFNKISVGTYLDHIEYLYHKIRDLENENSSLRIKNEKIGRDWSEMVDRINAVTDKCAVTWINQTLRGQYVESVDWRENHNGK